MSLAILVWCAGVADADTISLAWDANAELTVVGYMVHVGTQPGVYSQNIDVGLSTTYGWTGAVAGQQYCFAVSAYIAGRLQGPNSSEVCGYSNAPPTLANPGSRSSVAGQSTSLQLQGSDPDGQPVSYTATGMPPGLSVMVGTGFISGSPTTAGTYNVTATVSDGVLTSSQTFAWIITTPTDGSAPTITITGPTSAATFATTASSLTVSGGASDNVGVTQVSWASDRGGSGMATGSSSWSANIPLLTGSNTITVTARDAAGNISSDTIAVTRNTTTTNTAPIVNAGPDKTATVAVATSFTGTANDDGFPGPALTYSWTRVSGPGTVTFSNPSGLNTNATFPVVGTYVLRLSVSDSALTTSDDVTVTVIAAVTGPANGTGLRAEYFSGMTLQSLLLERVDPTVNFSWGIGTPGGNVPADSFSVRWTGEVLAPVTGLYYFSTVSDDGVRLWVNNQQVFNNWTNHADMTNTSAGISLQAGQRYAIRLEYYENTGYATARLQWTYPGQTTQAIPQTALFPAVATIPAATGLRGDYYSGRNFTSLLLTRIDPGVNFSWGSGAPAAGVPTNNFSVRWTGQLTVPVTGTYTFSTVSDDGVRLRVNNQLVISNWTDHGETTNTSPGIALQAGQKYTIQLDYYEAGGLAKIQLRWAYPGQTTQVIPQSALNP